MIRFQVCGNIFFKRQEDSVTEMIEARPITSRPSKAESMNGCPDPFISTYNISPKLHLSYLSRGSIVTRRDFFAALFSFLSRKVFVSTFNSSPPAPITNLFQQNLSPSWPSNLNETLSEKCTKAQEKFFLYKKRLLDDTLLSLVLLQFQPQIVFAGSGYRDRKQPWFSRPKATNDCGGGVKGKCQTSGFYNKKNHLSTFTPPSHLNILRPSFFQKKRQATAKFQVSIKRVFKTLYLLQPPQFQLIT